MPVTVQTSCMILGKPTAYIRLESDQGDGGALYGKSRIQNF